MGKVEITNEQALEIERLMSVGSRENIVRKFVNNVYERGPLFGLSLDELIRAMYEGYRVKLHLEIGDYVKDTSTGAVFKVRDNQHKNNLMDKRLTSIRLATKKEVTKRVRKIVDILEDEGFRDWLINNEFITEEDTEDIIKTAKELEKMSRIDE